MQRHARALCSVKHNSEKSHAKIRFTHAKSDCANKCQVWLNTEIYIVVYNYQASFYDLERFCICIAKLAHVYDLGVVSLMAIFSALDKKGWLTTNFNLLSIHSKIQAHSLRVYQFYNGKFQQQEIW